jgi:glycolate oxidase FAD binding subunit
MVTPADQAEAAEAVRLAVADGRAVFPIGGGTRQDYGGRPLREGMGLSLAGLNRVVDYQPNDMTITVEAGLTVGELARRLDAHGQWLPVDLARPERSTIGGAVAVNLVGSRRVSCGTLRDYVLGLTAIDGHGEAFSAGGRVVKNAAGLNVQRLLVGSLGTLGVVTQVTLMVRPQPRSRAILACRVAEMQAAERLLDELMSMPVSPSAIALLSGVGWHDRPLAAIDTAAGAVLLVGFEGASAVVHSMIGRLDEAERRSDRLTTAMVDNAAVADTWQALADFEADVQINVLPSQTVATMELLRGLEPAGTMLAQPGNGAVLLQLAPRMPAATAAFLRDELRPAVERAGGRATVVKSPAVAQFTPADVWGRPCEGASLHRAIKQRFDPNDVLNPGRFGHSTRQERVGLRCF